MSIQHHPDDATLVSYAAGSLPAPLALVVSAHIERCPHCAERARLATDIGGAMLGDREASLADAASLERCWTAVQARIDRIETGGSAYSRQGEPGYGSGVLSRYLPATYEENLDALPWRRISPGIHQYPILELSGSDAWVRLFRFDPGVAVPSHGHESQELSMVLQGSYRDEVGRFAIGDVADLDASIEHRPVVDSELPCIALIAAEGHLQFEQPIMRLGARWLGL